MEFGLEIEQFGGVVDGGAGRYRGGCGIIRDVRVLLDQMTLVYELIIAVIQHLVQMEDYLVTGRVM